jgi:hypothetical protein
MSVADGADREGAGVCAVTTAAVIASIKPSV